METFKASAAKRTSLPNARGTRKVKRIDKEDIIADTVRFRLPRD